MRIEKPQDSDHQLVKRLATELSSCEAIWIAGSGASEIVAQKFAHSLRTVGKRAFAISTESMLHGDFAGIQDADRLVLVSKSAQFADVSKLDMLFSNLSRPLILVTESKESPFQNSHIFSLPKTVESDPAHIIPTMSFSSMISFFDDTLIFMISHDSISYLEKFASGHPSGGIGKKFDENLDSLPFCPPVFLSPGQASVLQLFDIEKLISSSEVGALVLVDESGKLAGIFTDGDMRRHLSNHRQNLRVRGALLKHFGKSAIAIDENSSVRNLVRIFANHPEINVVPLLNENGHVTRMVHARHILSTMEEES